MLVARVLQVQLVPQEVQQVVMRVLPVLVQVVVVVVHLGWLELDMHLLVEAALLVEWARQAA
jgi:hypothetical protein